MIDWPRVRELKEEIGPDGFDEVIEIFLEEVEEVIDRLKSGQRDQLEQDLHFLKGSALNLGFADFSTLCQDGEKRSADGQAATVDVPQILASYDTSKTAFLEGYAANA